LFAPEYQIDSVFQARDTSSEVLRCLSFLLDPDSSPTKGACLPEQVLRTLRVAGFGIESCRVVRDGSRILGVARPVAKPGCDGQYPADIDIHRNPS
jgi:hypothetical protein